MTEAALEAFQEALRDDDAEQLYDRAPCGYLSTAPDGTIIKVNQTLLTWTGHERQALVGRRTFAELLSAGGRIYHETHYAPMLRMQGSVREIALEIVTASGARLPVLVNSVLERDAAGEPRVIRTAVFDATARREYERELVRAKERAEESEARAQHLARTLQETLIPPRPPAIPGLDVGAFYRAAGDGAEIGGDFYDVFQVADRDWVVVIGDVCGKGVEAAVVTALVRYTVRAVAVRETEPSRVLAALNEVLVANDTERFCTAAVVRLRQRGAAWQATLSSGGHPLPLFIGPDREPRLVGRAGSLVGVFDDAEFHDDVVDLGHGEGIVLYTDGVPEGRRGDEFYGDQRLHDAVRRCSGQPAADLAGCLVEEVLDFQSAQPRDDIAVVAVVVPR